MGEPSLPGTQKLRLEEQSPRFIKIESVSKKKKYLKDWTLTISDFSAYYGATSQAAIVTKAHSSALPKPQTLQFKFKHRVRR